MKTQTPLSVTVAFGWRFGLLLGGLWVINHSLEVFADLGPSLSAIRGVAMWAALFLVCSAASSAGYRRTRDVPLGVGASILAAITGAGILVLYAIGVGVGRGEPLSLGTIASTGGMHLVGSAIVGCSIGLVSGATAQALRRTSNAIAKRVAIGLDLLLAAGLSAIAYATGLDRSARPPFIMFGLPAVAAALAVAAPVFSALSLAHGKAEARRR